LKLSIVAKVNCSEDVIGPSYVVVGFDRAYVEMLKLRQAQVSSIQGMVSGDFLDDKVAYIEIPNAATLSEDIGGLIDHVNENQYAVTDINLCLDVEAMAAQGIKPMEVYLPTMRFFGSDQREPQVCFQAFIEDTNTVVECCQLPIGFLETVINNVIGQIH
jgi:hypothetical protein